ncbi:BA75_04290T0 [Komagataella pastoris]|uniref:BA75_04290T0 n=1 Tax=Komagataella pastoris TaxID=4922 RepID=A0A1B2JFJ0_PICPA|nr:BA75_04290T0 [Komagataella pastoris]
MDTLHTIDSYGSQIVPPKTPDRKGLFTRAFEFAWRKSPEKESSARDRFDEHSTNRIPSYNYTPNSPSMYNDRQSWFDDEPEINQTLDFIRQQKENHSRSLMSMYPGKFPQDQHGSSARSVFDTTKINTEYNKSMFPSEQRSTSQLEESILNRLNHNNQALRDISVQLEQTSDYTQLQQNYVEELEKCQRVYDAYYDLASKYQDLKRTQVREHHIPAPPAPPPASSFSSPSSEILSLKIEQLQKDLDRMTEKHDSLSRLYQNRTSRALNTDTPARPRTEEKYSSVYESRYKDTPSSRRSVSSRLNDPTWRSQRLSTSSLPRSRYSWLKREEDDSATESLIKKYAQA